MKGPKTDNAGYQYKIGFLPCEKEVQERCNTGVINLNPAQEEDGSVCFLYLGKGQLVGVQCVQQCALISLMMLIS